MTAFGISSQPLADGDLGRHARDRVAGRLRRQRRRAADARIDLDHGVLRRAVGSSANWTLQPPSMPSARMILQRGRAQHLVLLVGERLRLGATTMESPVWTPIGSKFSMLQMVMQVSAPSRITSYSISFQPSSERSTSTWWIGLASRPRWHDRRAARPRCSAMPPPVPPSVKAGRMIERQADRARRTPAPPRRVCTIDALRHRLADRAQQVLEQLAVLGLLDRLERRAEQPDVVALEDARVGELDGQVQAGLAAERRQQAVRPLALR